MTKNFIIFFTGLSGSGKSTLANNLYNSLHNDIPNLVKLDGDEFRKGVSLDLGFSIKDRTENVRRLKEVVKLLLQSNQNVIISFIAPTERIRDILRNEFKNIIEIYLDCSIATCIKRNPKKLYNKQIRNFTGISQKFEPSLKYHLKFDTSELSQLECNQRIINYLKYDYI